MDKETIIKRLASLGYTFNDVSDSWVLGFLFDKVTNSIKDSINRPEIPEALYQVFVDMVAGEFLLMKKSTGGLDGFEVDTEAVAVKSIQQGDTSVSFAVDKTMSAEERLNAVINYLLNYGKPQFLRHRRLVW